MKCRICKYKTPKRRFICKECVDFHAVQIGLQKVVWVDWNHMCPGREHGKLSDGFYYPDLINRPAIVLGYGNHPHVTSSGLVFKVLIGTQITEMNSCHMKVCSDDS